MESVSFEDMRRAMVDSQLRTSGVTEGWVIAAMGKIAREDYVPVPHRTIAYMDRAITLDDGNVLNPPVASALMLQAADVSVDDIVLLIGQPNGYLADVLKTRVRQLTAVEPENFANAHLSAPFSLIIIDGAVEELPNMLVDMAADGARVVTGIVEGAVTRLAVGHVHKGKVALKAFVDSEIAPIAAFARKSEFVF